MKKVLLATSVLAMTAGFASAEVTVSGTARMGVIADFGDADPAFTSRVRIIFTASGETDSGLSFGATVRNDQSGVGNTENGDSVVYISGAFGKLSMGDVDGAAAAAVGQVDPVGLTGLSDLNEIAYILGNEDTSALYEYSTGSIGLYFSAQPNDGNSNFGVGANYTMGDYKFGIGYENVEDGSTPGSGWPDKIGFSPFFGNGATQVVLGADATFGPVTAKVRFARYDEDNIDAGMDQAALSVTYTADALAVTGFYSNFRGTDGYDGDDADFYGVGASYDLGGGATVVGGYSSADYGAGSDDAFDLGLSFSF
jgi:outer membrane protein OmpU